MHTYMLTDMTVLCRYWSWIKCLITWHQQWEWSCFRCWNQQFVNYISLYSSGLIWWALLSWEIVFLDFETFITDQHAMHAERNIVLPVLSVHLSVCLSVCLSDCPVPI